MGTECSKLRQPMPAIFALSRAQLLLLVVTRSRDLSRECHVTKHKTPARSNFPLSNFEHSGTIQFSSSSSTSRGLCPKNFEKRAHTNQTLYENSFGVRGPRMWNCIPADTRAIQSMDTFKSKITQLMLSVPDTPFIRGYTPINSNSILEWRNNRDA